MATASWADWVTAVAALISAGVAIALLWQLYLAKQQLVLTVQWNRMNAVFTYFSTQEFADRERAVAERLSMLGINFYHQRQALDSSIVASVLEDSDHLDPIKNFLNYLEYYSAAVRKKIADPEMSYKLTVGVITRYYRVFEPLIEARRENNKRAWLELEELALEWEPKRIEEEKWLIQETEEAHTRNEGERREARRKLTLEDKGYGD